MQLALCGEHAKEVANEQALLHDFVPFGALEYLDRGLVAELGLNHIVQCVEVDSIVTFLDGADVADSGKIEDSFTVQANDTSFVQLQEALFLVNDNRLDFSAIQEYESKYADKNCDDILPPVTTMKRKLEGKTRVSSERSIDDNFESLGEETN